MCLHVNVRKAGRDDHIPGNKNKLCLTGNQLKQHVLFNCGINTTDPDQLRAVMEYECLELS